MPVWQQIVERIAEAGDQAIVPTQRAGHNFSAEVYDANTIWVSNLGTSPYIRREAFEKAVELLTISGGAAPRGDAMNCRLGDAGLTLATVEGYVAHHVYGVPIGGTVFRRITPIANILVWAGICEHGKGTLILRPEWMGQGL